ncbi:hypothetical protein B484DRAFT_456576 [Ochromonadaceae sp. CCMP2298]|nr:hypothetical protein B484DRAFT_456576 [Ochromonadaceae sp. CCMP2298]|mmetsp:Transcript_30412/g.67975  ORF Transcript_30412/g.67975 Transcript_30412/m.67975 type:complete len:314 (+) Transcript_30412:78-1019(+)
MLPDCLVNTNWNSAEETLNQSLFTRLLNVRDIDQRIFSVLQEFKLGCKRLRKADVEKGGAVLIGKPLDAKRAEEEIQFYCCVAFIILERDHQALCPMFPLLSARELLQVFPDFQSVQSDELEIGRLSVYYRLLGALSLATPSNKKGKSMMVAARMESGSVYVMGGGARPETRHRALIYKRLCGDKTQGKGYWDPLGSHKSLLTLPTPPTDYSICSSLSGEETDEESSVLGKRQRQDDSTTTTRGAKRALARPDSPSSLSSGSTDSDVTDSDVTDSDSTSKLGNSATVCANGPRDLVADWDNLMDDLVDADWEL